MARVPRILVGDVGATNARLALHEGEDPAPLAEAVFPTRGGPTLAAIAKRFLANAETRADVAIIGVAGPVKHGKVHLTNVGWNLDERSLAKRIGVRRVVLKNDLVVAARGCLEVKKRELVAIDGRYPKPRGENVGVIAAGTGLGEARLLWIDGRHVALPTEGGHGDFAPRTPLEIELWHFLATRFKEHVSYERVLSGAGLGALYDFFRGRSGREPRAIARRFEEEDRNKVIAELGLARAHRPASRAVDTFASIYGAEAGNLALRELARGGVFVTGSIGKTILPARQKEFMEGFLRKGRFASMLAEIPIAIVTDPLVGLRGALAFAREAAE